MFDVVRRSSMKETVDEYTTLSKRGTKSNPTIQTTPIWWWNCEIVLPEQATT
jgi:hypothetical protein